MDSDLHLAVVSDDTDVLKAKDWLIIGDQRTPANNTVLHLACQHGSIGCVNEILSSHESLLLQTNSRGESALHLAPRQGHYDAVEALINKAKSTVPQPSNLKNTSTTVLQNLIRARNVEFETALHAAVRYNRENVVELLVKKDPGYSYPQNKYDETPLYLAAVRGYAGVIEIILDNCESPTFGGPDGRTALHGSLMRAARDSETNDAWDSVDGNGQNILHIAVMQNQKEVVENLLPGTIDSDLMNSLFIQKDKEGNTPLHLIAKFGFYFPQLQDTIQWNADWEVVNNANVTPKDVLHQEQTGILIDDQEVRVYIRRELAHN